MPADPAPRAQGAAETFRKLLERVEELLDDGIANAEGKSADYAFCDIVPTAVLLNDIQTALAQARPESEVTP